MNFNSIAFAFFMFLVFCVYWKVPNKYRKWVLLVASCYFYLSYGIFPFLLLCGVIFISYFISLLIATCNRSIYRKILLVGMIAAIIALLGRYKYYDFLVDNLNVVLNIFVIQLHPRTISLILPVGISFYSFKILSYIVDVYQGREPESNLGKYALFIVFFPEVTSGPIDRAENLLPQFSEDHTFNYEKVTYGLKLVAWGLFKKIVIADTLAYCVDSVYGSYNSYMGFVLFLTSVLYTIQIYCDFSGYSDMAVGLARMLDIDVKENFKSPYFSSSVTEFWRRWHISLSLWLRDYIYIPMGGSRKGKVRTYINTMCTFLVSGLWHGANWTYILWGCMHGSAVIMEKILCVGGGQICSKYKCVRLKRVVKMAAVFLFCNFAWIFFRADSIKQALYFLKYMFWGMEEPLQFIVKGFRDLPCVRIVLWKIALLIFTLFVFDFYNKEKDVILWVSKRKKMIRWVIYCVFVFLMIAFLPAEPGKNFVYFQF